MNMMLKTGEKKTIEFSYWIMGLKGYSSCNKQVQRVSRVRSHTYWALYPALNNSNREKKDNDTLVSALEQFAGSGSRRLS